MEKYQPIRFLQLMNDGLRLVLGKREMQVLQRYITEKHKEFQDAIVMDDGVPKEMRKLGSEDIERMIAPKEEVE